MALRFALVGLPAAAIVVLVLLLNSLGANAGIAVASLGLVAVASGAALGFFADRLPELPKRRRHPDDNRRLASVHHAHR